MIARRLLAVLLVLGAALLALVALTLPAGAEDPAGDGGAAALAAHEIQWTRYPAGGTERIREGFGNAIWGGGSFLKLIGKLVIEGCNVNAIAVYDAEGEEMLFLHHFQVPDFVNADFGRGRYMRDVPAGAVLAFTCADVCDIIVGPGASEIEHLIETCKSVEEKQKEREQDKLFAITSDCSRVMDFTAEVNRHFVPAVPMFQDTCMQYFSSRESATKIGGLGGGLNGGRCLDSGACVWFRAGTPSIMMNDDSLPLIYDDANTPQENTGYFYHRRGIMHELCHVHQDWYDLKFYRTYSAAGWPHWTDTSAGKAFIDMIGYKKVGEGFWEWELDEDNVYHGSSYTNTQPRELAADICSDYFLERIFENEYPEFVGRFVSPRILNQETRAWVEKYIAVD